MSRFIWDISSTIEERKMYLLLNREKRKEIDEAQDQTGGWISGSREMMERGDVVGKTAGNFKSVTSGKIN